eukprot:193587-Chlamydomonas_euryale.AAC.1
MDGKLSTSAFRYALTMQIDLTLLEKKGENLLSRSVAEPEPDASEERDPRTSGAPRSASPAVRFS